MLTFFNNRKKHLLHSTCFVLYIFFFISGFSVCYGDVSLSEGTTDYHHDQVTLNSDHTLASTSGNEVVDTYNTLVLENDYLKIELVPDHSARIISMYYKPTGHDELWRHPQGYPFSIGANSFFYDYLMVWGGIFPTMTAPEHGKYWSFPWSYEIVKNTSDTVSVMMSQRDTVPYRNSYAGKFSSYYDTGIECRFTVTMVAGRTGIYTDVELINPNSGAVEYEYWTCTTLSPGSDQADPHLTENAFFVIPDDTVKIPPSWGAIRDQEISAGGDWFVFDNLREWKNWPSAGIIYAQPEENFWGAINRDDSKNEGIIRVADNSITKACKMWTNGRNGLPYFEPWAGVSDEFFVKTTLDGNSELRFQEFYTPTLNLENVTDASDMILCNFVTDKSVYDGSEDDSVQIECSFFATEPGKDVSLEINFFADNWSSPLYDNILTPDASNGNTVSFSAACEDIYNGCNGVRAVFTDIQGRSLLITDRPLSFANCATGISKPFHIRNGRGKGEAAMSVYTLDGKVINQQELSKTKTGMDPSAGVYIIRRKGKNPVKRLRGF